MLDEQARTPAWVMWALGLGASVGVAAFFYFLEKQDRKNAGRSAIGTVFMALAAVGLMIRDGRIDATRADAESPAQPSPRHEPSEKPATRAPATAPGKPAAAAEPQTEMVMVSHSVEWKNATLRVDGNDASIVESGLRFTTIRVAPGAHALEAVAGSRVCTARFTAPANGAVTLDCH